MIWLPIAKSHKTSESRIHNMILYYISYIHICVCYIYSLMSCRVALSGHQYPPQSTIHVSVRSCQQFTSAAMGTCGGGGEPVFARVNWTLQFVTSPKVCLCVCLWVCCVVVLFFTRAKLLTSTNPFCFFCSSNISCVALRIMCFHAQNIIRSNEPHNVFYEAI